MKICFSLTWRYGHKCKICVTTRTFKIYRTAFTLRNRRSGMLPKIIVFRSSHRCIFQYRCSELVVQLSEKYLWYSAVLNKFSCSAFLFLTTGAEEIYFITTSFCWITTFVNHPQKLLLCSEKLEKILRKHME